MSRSRLPPPPGRGGGKPLPPPPPAGEGDVPPPLPSRPGGKPGSARLPPPPVLNGQSPQSSDDEGMTYEEPDLPPEPPRSRHQQPPPPEPQQETYDDLEDVQAQPTEEPQETYDECDLKPASQQQQQQVFEEDQLYEEEPPMENFPPPAQDTMDGDGDLYEFMPETEEQPPPVPTPPAHSRPHIPLPPNPNSMPSLPARPPPSRPPDRDSSPDGVPDLPPGRPVPSQPTPKLTNIKKISGDGPQMLGISQEAIGLKRANLKKVMSDEAREPDPVPVEPAANTDDPSSVKARINMFKQAEKGGKPALAAKPFLPVKPQLASKPEVKSPPPAVRTPPQPSPVKHTPPPPVFEESDEIYDEGFSYMPDPLNKEEWYHGEIERADTTSRLQSLGQDGTFLVRKSKQGGDTQPYTLAVLYQGHVYNLKMRNRTDGQVALGEEKSDELAFKDVPALINHHKSHDVILVNVKEKKQYKTLLKKHPINVNAN